VTYRDRSATTTHAEPDPAALVRYLSPAHRALLRRLWIPADERDGDAGESDRVTLDDLEAAVADEAPAHAPTPAREALEAWNAVDEAGVVGGRDNTYRTFVLTEYGEALMAEYAGRLDDLAVPREERDAEDWAESPVPLEQKFAELVEEFLALRDDVEDRQ